MACKGCEERRKALARYAAATAEWLKKPGGPPPHVIAQRMEAEEKARENLDDNRH